MHGRGTRLTCVCVAHLDFPLHLFPCSERALQHWRTTVSPKLSQLPLIGRLIDWFWPTPTRQPLHSGADGLGGSIDFLARSFGAGLLLPFAAFVVGRVCFQSTKNSYKRVVLVNFNTKVFGYLVLGCFLPSHKKLMHANWMSIA